MQTRSPLAAVAALAIGIVLGFVLGQIGPRAELAEREEEVADLERRLEHADTGGWRSPVPGFDRILRAPEDERAPSGPIPEPRSEADGADPATGDPAPAEVVAVDGLDGGVPRSRWRERWRGDSPDDRLEGFQRAAAVQQVRRMQSRAALVQQADLDDEETAELDAALGEMNDALQGHGEELLILAMGDEPPPARDLLGITHDVTGILHRAQTRVERLLGSERAAEVDASALEIWNHVDLSRLEPAARAAIGRAP